MMRNRHIAFALVLGTAMGEAASTQASAQFYRPDVVEHCNDQVAKMPELRALTSIDGFRDRMELACEASGRVLGPRTLFDTKPWDVGPYRR
jgi:hypothetical protein